MADYNHPQFTPEFNRVRGGGGVGIMGEQKPPRVQQKPVDPADPYFPVHTGLFTGSAEDNSGKQRKYLFYIPGTVKPSGNSVFVFCGAGQSLEDCFEQGNWKEKLEKYESAGFFVAPDGDWNKQAPGEELDFFLRVYEQARDLEYYASNGDALYAIGLGSGAYMATVFSLLYSSVFAAFAAAGSCDLDKQLLTLIGSLPSDGDATIPKSANPMPAWILDENGSGKAVAEYLKAACGAKEENLRSDIAGIWRETPKPGTLYLNEQPVTEVWYSDASALSSLSQEELADRMLAFVTGYKRWGGVGNWHIRRSKSPEEMGFVKKELTVDGLKRHWWVYEPTACKKGLKDSFPLVVAIHGFSCSGPFYAENSNWEAVAEERDLIVAFPTAYPYPRKPRGTRMRVTCPTPAWNSFAGGDPDGPDDVKFIGELVKTMKEKYPVDPTRVYVTGHSNGGAMTQMLMRRTPELFAAFAPIGAMEASFGYIPEPMPSDTVRPVWYTMGEYDLGAGDKLEEGNANDLTIRNLCACNKADFEGASRYVCGVYKNLVAYNANRVPLVRFTGVTGWPHTVTPETSLKIYDEFFCQFIRKADGTSVYLG